MKPKVIYPILTLITMAIFIYSCNLNIISNKISVQITKGAGNNYYEIDIISNINLTPTNTNSFSFSLNDSNNVLLETATGKLENGVSSWTSVKIYTYGAYVVVVKIDQTGDNTINIGDIYSYKFVIVSNDNGYINFSDTDSWYSLN
ncbi:MAG: hypothetical protein ACPL4C_04270 [Brevinematia bacterium]